MTLNERELEAQIEVFKKDAMELWFVPNLADTYKNKDLFSYSIMDGEVFFMREQARQLWNFWNKAKAQAVPETQVLIPKELPDDLNDQIWDEYLTPLVCNGCDEIGYICCDDLDLEKLYQLIVKASESGAEG